MAERSCTRYLVFLCLCVNLIRVLLNLVSGWGQKSSILIVSLTSYIFCTYDKTKKGGGNR